MKRILLTAGLALIVAAPASARPATTPLSGVVVGVHQGLVLVAAPGGKVTAVPGRALPGTRVVVRAGRLVATGHARRANVTGVLIRRTAHATFLSAARHVLVVRSGPATATAAPGTVVQTHVEIEHGVLQEEDEHQVGDRAKIEFEGLVTAVGAGTVTLTVGGQALTLPLPAGVTLPASLVGQTLELELSFPAAAVGIPPARDDDDDDADRVVVTTATPSVATSTSGRRHGGDDGRDRSDDDGGHHGGGEH